MASVQAFSGLCVPWSLLRAWAALAVVLGACGLRGAADPV
jgi:hypothetical protein